jgi:hypothetical protein
MPISATYEQLRKIAEVEFNDIVVNTEIEVLPTSDPRKLRIHLVDGSFADVFVSVTGRYSYHWQRTPDDGNAIYRHDNAPHASWNYVSTFPKHFHDGSEDNVVESHLSSTPSDALREFCTFVRQTLRT